jgi:hypothetical protein
MVEHIMRNPDAAPISESALQPEPLPRHGLCLICGEWLDGEQGEDAYAVTLARGGDVFEHVSHAACLARVAHESARLPGGERKTMPEVVPENYLASKFRTPSGR